MYFDYLYFDEYASVSSNYTNLNNIGLKKLRAIDRTVEQPDNCRKFQGDTTNSTQTG